MPAATDTKLHAVGADERAAFQGLDESGGATVFTGHGRFQHFRGSLDSAMAAAAVYAQSAWEEWMILPTAGGEYYCVIAIFGVEFVINLGGPELDGWNAWLAANGKRSPLFEAPKQDGGVSE